MPDDVYTVKPYITNDLSMSAYLVMNGMRLIKARRLGKSFKFEFEPDPKLQQLIVNWPSSESSRFDDHVRKLKSVVYNGVSGHQKFGMRESEVEK